MHIFWVFQSECYESVLEFYAEIGRYGVKLLPLSMRIPLSIFGRSISLNGNDSYS